MREADLVKSILEQVNYYGFFWRNNTGAQKITSTAGIRFLKFGYRGSSDILGVVKGKFVAIEVKSPTGRQSAYQSEFQRIIEKNGGIYILAKRPDDALKIIRGI